MHIGDLGQVNAADRPYAAPEGRCSTNNGQRSALAPNGSVAIDPKRTAATEMPHRGANFSPRHADEIPSLQME
jgi:hypothetical protein